MTSYQRNLTKYELLPLTALLLFTITLNLGCSKQNARAATNDSVQATYETPAEAGQALQAASRANDDKAMAHILGPQSQANVNSGDPSEDRAAAESFVAKYDRMNRWVTMTDGSRVLYIGADNYPFPIPLARNSESKWYFNRGAGEDEILARRIGKNELLAIDACTSIANAEELYRRETQSGGSLHQYSKNILSSPGKQDGLHWEVSEGEPSPLGKLGDIAKLAAASATADGSPVFDGYSFRILTAQGEQAEGGAGSYIVDGKFTGGFAVIARPVKYQDSGIMTFILSREGVVYQKDLGENTASIADSISSYNPGDGWTPAE